MVLYSTGSLWSYDLYWITYHLPPNNEDSFDYDPYDHWPVADLGTHYDLTIMTPCDLESLDVKEEAYLWGWPLRILAGGPLWPEYDDPFWLWPIIVKGVAGPATHLGPGRVQRDHQDPRTMWQDLAARHCTLQQVKIQTLSSTTGKDLDIVLYNR